MPHVIAQGCCNDASCVAVCPVQCIRPRPGDPNFTTTEQLYIDPSSCIDCGACAHVCPTETIFHDAALPPTLDLFRQLNSDYFEANPLQRRTPLPVNRRSLPPPLNGLRIAIVGTGPSGLYAAAELSEIEGVSVTLIERLPGPYGLLRSGVAPDHLRTRQVSERFDPVLSRPNVTCLFDVEVGHHTTIAEVASHHHAVLWAVGTPQGRRLGVPGEELPGVFTARELTAWYNGHPDFTQLEIPLRGPRAVVLGNGNVALDIARILTRPAHELEETAISPVALQALRASGITEVLVVGRRSHSDAAYGTAELLELASLTGVDLLAHSAETTSTADELARAAGTFGPKTALRRQTILEEATRRRRDAPRRVVMRYRLTPTRFLGVDHVAGVELTGADGVTERIDASLIVTAIGFRGVPIDGVPFDAETGTVPSRQHRVIDPGTGTVVTGLYGLGWVKRGPSGSLGTNRVDAAATIDAVMEDLQSGRLPAPRGSQEDFVHLIAERRARAINLGGRTAIDD